MVKRIRPESKKLLRELISEDRIVKYFQKLRGHHSETYAHSLRVGLLSIDLGYDNSFSEEDLRQLGYGAILHDSGKLRIPKDILGKKGKLSDKEKQIMNMHTWLGFFEVGDIKSDSVKTMVVSHHEYKKDPYPRSGNDRRLNNRDTDRREFNEMIHIASQIIAVADIYDALARSRSYKEQLSLPEIESILREQFTGDPKYMNQVLNKI